MSIKLPTKLSEMFGLGNEKLGKALTFSLPAIDTCPGRSHLCEAACYATQGHYNGPVVQNRLDYNLALSKHKSFVKLAVDFLAEATKKKPRLFRIHPAGDFYNPIYAAKWLTIMEKSPDVRFWFYTRSWRVPAILPTIVKMSKLPNVQGWFSIDKETGYPKKIPDGIHTAYMQVDGDDFLDKEPDLYFRDYPLRKDVQKFIHGVIVCPPENGVTHTQCDKCRICIRKAPPPHIAYDGGPARVSLPVLA